MLFAIIKMTTINGYYLHFQEDSNTLKYILFGYYMNKLWIFEILIVASPKAWVGNTKIMIQHDFQLVYIYGLL